MKRILLIIFMTFTTSALADEGDYLMTAENGGGSWMWILDAKKDKVKACETVYTLEEWTIKCTRWKDLNDK